VLSTGKWDFIVYSSCGLSEDSYQASGDVDMSSNFTPVRTAAKRNCRPAPAKEIVTMHPANKSQIAVWKSFIPARTGIRSDWIFTRNLSLEELSIRWATIPRFLRKSARSSRRYTVFIRD